MLVNKYYLDIPDINIINIYWREEDNVKVCFTCLLSAQIFQIEDMWATILTVRCSKLIFKDGNGTMIVKDPKYLKVDTHRAMPKLQLQLCWEALLSTVPIPYWSNKNLTLQIFNTYRKPIPSPRLLSNSIMAVTFITFSESDFPQCLSHSQLVRQVCGEWR